MPTIQVSQVIPAKQNRVYQFLEQMEEFPRYMKNLETVRCLERGQGYTVTEWVARLRGSRFRWVERDTFDPVSYRIDFQQTEGDLKVFRGYWLLTKEDAATQVTLVTEFEFGMPMLASLLNPVAKIALRDNARGMVEAIASAVQEGTDNE